MIPEQPALPVDRWTSGFVQAGGIAVHWTRTGGTSSSVVLAHGFTDDGLCWSPIAAALESACDCVMLDARGHGRSDAPERGYGPLVMAEDLAQTIVGLRLERPTVVGHSMGAVAALVAACTHPDLIRALVLEDPPASWLLPPAGGRLRPPEVTRARHDIVALQRLDRSALIARGRADNPRWSDAELGPWADAKLRVAPAAAGALDPAAHMLIDWPAMLRKITCPVLVIGADPAPDARLSVEGAAMLSQHVPHARIERVVGAGHSVRRDVPDEYLRLVRDSLGLTRAAV